MPNTLHLQGLCSLSRQIICNDDIEAEMKDQQVAFFPITGANLPLSYQFYTGGQFEKKKKLQFKS